MPSTSTNADLLAITDSLINANGNPWLKVKALDNGEKIPATLIDRGLRLYDTPYARGRPVVNFAITRPGAYELTHPRRNITMSIVPDYSTGRETLFTLIYLVQIALVAGIVVFFWRRRTRTEREAGKTEREAWINAPMPTGRSTQRNSAPNRKNATRSDSLPRDGPTQNGTRSTLDRVPFDMLRGRTRPLSQRLPPDVYFKLGQT